MKFLLDILNRIAYIEIENLAGRCMPELRSGIHDLIFSPARRRCFE